MRRIFSVTFMAAILATMIIVTSVDMISDAEALKSKGTSTGKYGSATKGVVCGDRLCSEINQTETSNDNEISKSAATSTKSPPMTTASSAQSGDVSVDSIIGATVQNTEMDKQSGIATLSIDAKDDGNVIVNLDSSIMDVFMVIVDGEEWDDVYIEGDKMDIFFYAGTEKIEIFGDMME